MKDKGRGTKRPVISRRRCVPLPPAFILPPGGRRSPPWTKARSSRWRSSGAAPSASSARTAASARPKRTPSSGNSSRWRTRARPRFIVDLSDVSFVTSSCLGALMVVHKRVRPQGGYVRLASAAAAGAAHPGDHQAHQPVRQLPHRPRSARREVRRLLRSRRNFCYTFPLTDRETAFGFPACSTWLRAALSMAEWAARLS